MGLDYRPGTSRVDNSASSLRVRMLLFSPNVLFIKNVSFLCLLVSVTTCRFCCGLSLLFLGHPLTSFWKYSLRFVARYHIIYHFRAKKVVNQLQ